MKIKKFTAIISAVLIVCTAPVGVYATDIATDAIVDEIIENETVNELMENPDQVAEIIISAKNIIQAQNITDGDIGTGIDMAAEELGITLSDSERSMVISIASKLVNADITDEEIRNTVNKVYSTAQELGIGKEEVKGILRKIIDFAKSII